MDGNVPCVQSPSIVSARLPTWWAHRCSRRWADGLCFKRTFPCLSFTLLLVGASTQKEVSLRPLLVSADLSSLQRFGSWQCVLTFVSPLALVLLSCDTRHPRAEGEVALAQGTGSEPRTAPAPLSWDGLPSSSACQLPISGIPKKTQKTKQN